MQPAKAIVIWLHAGVGGHSSNSVSWRPLDDVFTMVPSSFYAGAVESA